MIQGLGLVRPRLAGVGLEDGGVQDCLDIRGIESPFQRPGLQQVERSVRNALRGRRRVARRVIWLSPHDFAPKAEGARSARAAFFAALTACAGTAERAGATPLPALRCSPGSDPLGGRSCPLCVFGN